LKDVHGAEGHGSILDSEWPCSLGQHMYLLAWLAGVNE
jgi:hypothetical protein